jgi:hypothetical protein
MLFTFAGALVVVDHGIAVVKMLVRQTSGVGLGAAYVIPDQEHVRVEARVGCKLLGSRSLLSVVTFPHLLIELELADLK